MLPVMLLLSGIGLYSCSGWTWKQCTITECIWKVCVS